MRRLRRFLMLGCAAGIAACSREQKRIDRAFQWSQQVTPGATLHLRNLNGNIEVRPATGTAAIVTASKTWRRGDESDVHFVTTRAGLDYYVCAMYGSRGRCDASGYTTNRPSIWRLLSLRRHSSDVQADFTVALPPGVAVDGFTIRGSADVQGATAGLKFRTVSGSIVAQVAGGPVRLQSTNGNITSTVASVGAGPYVFETVNGTIDVAMPASFQGEVSLATVNGRASSDFALGANSTREARSLQGTIGAGGPTVALRTVNGTVQLRRAGP